MEELVILVNEQDAPTGTAPKATVHSDKTPLHRGFSLFLFNSRGELLVTQRAKTKKTFPGVWSNTVCGHPAPGESAVEAARRRLKDELGMMVEDIREAAPYRYRFADTGGVVENEICPILIAQSDADPKPDPAEISEWKWIPWEEFLAETENPASNFSPWCRQEARLIPRSAR